MNSDAAIPSYIAAAANLTRGQLLDLMLDVEDRLRQLIRAVFVQQEQSGWETLIPGPVLEQLHRKRVSEAADPWAMKWKNDLLDFASLSQLIDLVKSKWKLFEPILSDKLYVAAKLEEFKHFRNALAHGNHPTPEERLQIVFLIDQVSLKLLVGQRPWPAPLPSSGGPPRQALYGLEGRRVLWVDDHPENNRFERRVLEDLGAEVVPLLSNGEALLEASSRPFDLVISDIARDEGESGSELGVRLAAAGFKVPIIFFVGRIEPGLEPPLMGIAVTNDRAVLLRHVLNCLV